MLKGKLKLPRPLPIPDQLGSLIAGGSESEEFEFGEELEPIHPAALRLHRESDDAEEAIDNDDEGGGGGNGMDHKTRQRLSKDTINRVSVLKSTSEEEKRSDLEHELSQREINLEKLQRIASTGIPDGGGLRATAWKLLLGYLPSSQDLWEKELKENIQKYSNLKEELLLNPSEHIWREGKELSSTNQHKEGDSDGLLRRHEISQEDHPLSLGKASLWSRYFKEAMKNILLLFAKLNPVICYVQGMNEVLAPIYYVFTIDTHKQNAVSAEADCFFCFVRVLGDSVDHFCQQLDNSSSGILSTLSRLSDLLKVNDEQLWHHLEFTTKVKPQFYAFRWITLLLTQEFKFESILRIWDTLLSNPFGVQDMLLRVCCAMLLCVKSKLLGGDFVANLKLLQHYPEDINLEYLLQVAQDISPDTSSYCLSL
ncbi:uncharacterized protein LOC107472050 isoform X3 [Arachis duranensis]|uniref:Uncharacterized protein LOC107472050 isoform X3 n=1 Tax=Arachis duranensis TaxID=130453 RepID=A0A6P4BSD6_ARADU|nr:uncharacterized protein LOC107472050 isoform X3 [Arachis duranensis]